MCGIAGVVYSDPTARVDPALLERMCDAIRHRGPDDSGVWLGPGIGLGHRRLSVIDLSPAGRQPMANEDGSVQIVFNGEIYNFQELREQLVRKGHAFRSHTDTEVIVHLYEELGDRCVDELDGMFAFALWDQSRRRLLLARDRLGKKPLKYAEFEGGLLFASELKGLLGTGLVPREVEPGDLHDYLTFGYVPSPHTGLRGIRKLPAANRLVWEGGRHALERYWTLSFREKRTLDPDEWVQEARGAVRSAVERRMVADVPLGAFLSGGIDSSIVVACMAEASSRPIETFSIGFEHEKHNELPFARRLAERYETSHHEFVVRADDPALLPTLARLYEEPYSDSSALPSYFLARETRRHVTVALNGDGGDEGFGGYQRYAEFQRQRLRFARPAARAALSLADRLHGALPPRLARRVAMAHGISNPDAGLAYQWMVRFLTDREKQWLYRPELRTKLEARSGERLSRWFDDPDAGASLLDRMCFTDVMGYLPDDLLVKMDLATMAHGLEARSPLLDHHVLELAASAPADARNREGELKGLLKHAFRELLPPSHLDRPKSGFGIPIQDWLRGPWADFARDHLLAPDTRILAYFRQDALRQVMDRHAAGRMSYGHQIWALLMLELWHRELVEAPTQ